MSDRQTEPDPVPAIVEALRAIDDPEIGANIVDLGLIYRIERDGTALRIEMALTSPTCPMGESIVEQVERAVRRCLPPGAAFDLSVVEEPPWDPSRMSPALRRSLGWDD
jgi:metal-sulfur cluster biosynthetic enzyme